jgi:hypothetical protein
MRRASELGVFTNTAALGGDALEKGGGRGVLRRAERSVVGLRPDLPDGAAEWNRMSRVCRLKQALGVGWSELNSLTSYCCSAG